MRTHFSLFCVLLIAGLGIITPRISAQSPNTASIVVTAVDQNGAVVRDAKVSVLNNATADTRESFSDSNGTVTIPALSLSGSYTVTVYKDGFGSEERRDITLRSGETASLKVTLMPGSQKAEVTVFGTTEGVKNNPQIALPLQSDQINETPILGRKVSALPLLNSAFKQGKGTGDLFVNQTYFITGAGSRRTTTVTLDGANNDEGWGRQTAIATVPLGSIQEIAVISNAFSAEFGWTAGPALNIVTKSGTNDLHGEGLVLIRPGSWQAETFSTKNFCPPSVSTCVTPSTLKAINPVDIPDELQQYSGTIGGPIIKDRTFLFATTDYTRQNRTTFLSPILPAFVLPQDGHLDVTGHYRQFLFDGRLDHKLTSNQNLMFRFNVDRFYDDNPQDAVGGTNAPSVARRYTRRSWTLQINHTTVINPRLLNEARFGYLHGDPVTLWEAQNLSTTYTRSGTVPFTVGQSRASNLWSHQWQFSDTLSWSRGKHYLRLGGAIVHHTSGGFGSEPGTAILGTFTFKNSTTAPLDQLTLADVQNYTQPINFGISTYNLSQWLNTVFAQDSIHLRTDFTLDVGLRYDRQTLTDSKHNFAPRIGIAWHPYGDARTSIRGGYAMYYTQIRSNLVAWYLVNGLDGLATYTANPGETGFPTCLVGPCLPVPVDPTRIPAKQLPARDITIKAGLRTFYEQQFAKYGLNFDLLPNYPNEFVNPRSQVITVGAEHEFFDGFFFSGDFVHQHWSDLDRTVDLNAPAPFIRRGTGPTQIRSVADANKTRPILPANGGIRQVNVIMNLGVADYDGFQTQFTYRGRKNMYASVGYTISRALNNFEPDGNGIAPNESDISRLGWYELGPSVVDQRHRAVLTFNYRFRHDITAGTVSTFASGRPFNATTGVDNNGDGLNNDRPFINGSVIGKSAFHGTSTQDVAAFVEKKIKTSERTSILLRVEGFNLFNHGNFLGRGATIYGNDATAAPTFGQFVNGVGTSSNAIPNFAHIDPPRTFQLQARFVF